MDSTSLLAIGSIALIVNALILYIIIAAATNANKRTKYEWAQTELLAKIARAQGIPADEIKALFDKIS